jgi:hypothetical protein
VRLSTKLSSARETISSLQAARPLRNHQLFANIARYRHRFLERLKRPPSIPCGMHDDREIAEVLSE